MKSTDQKTFIEGLEEFCNKNGYFLDKENLNFEMITPHSEQLLTEPSFINMDGSGTRHYIQHKVNCYTHYVKFNVSIQSLGDVTYSPTGESKYTCTGLKK